MGDWCSTYSVHICGDGDVVPPLESGQVEQIFTRETMFALRFFFWGGGGDIVPSIVFKRNVSSIRLRCIVLTVCTKCVLWNGVEGIELFGRT